MLDRSLAYRYDGSFDGFLCCVFESYVRKEIPAAILPEESEQGTLFPEKWIETVPEHAQRVFLSLGKRISTEAEEIIRVGFLTCVPEKELLLYRFIRLGYQYGPRVVDRLADPTVCALNKALLHQGNEAHRIKQFLRFSEYEGVLAGIVEPKNFVLPLVAEHFCSRYPEERFFIYDRTHGAGLWYEPYDAQLLRVDNFALPEETQPEQEMKALWKRFVETIAVEGRINPRCQMTMMPKRYWRCMSEHRDNLTPTQRGDWYWPQELLTTDPGGSRKSD